MFIFIFLFFIIVKCAIIAIIFIFFIIIKIKAKIKIFAILKKEPIISIFKITILMAFNILMSKIYS